MTNALHGKWVNKETCKQKDLNSRSTLLGVPCLGHTWSHPEVSFLGKQKKSSIQLNAKGTIYESLFMPDLRQLVYDKDL